MQSIRLAFFCLIFLATSCRLPEPAYPVRVLDPALSAELIGSQPEVMTPIGLAIDNQDALFVLESHTHSPLSDYQGPEFDRIKKGTDQNGDGQIDQWQIFADSIADGMNLAFGPEGKLYLTTRNQVLVFEDRDQDGISDRKTELLRLEKAEKVYEHAALLGISVSDDGWLYVSRGNCGGYEWEINGSDGSRIGGYGDGGNVFRCRTDGSQLEEIATGFWNPFDLRFDHQGNLWLTDNDPDSRGPNRLINLTPGGNYGYQSLYGGSGNHPYLAWNGELPGTLPYSAPLGEAPCGLMDASYTNFPAAYRNQILVNVWEENKIVAIDFSQGTPVSKTLVQGDSTFHPVAFATDSKGNLYLTDWVIRQYPNHGSGKIWRISGHSQKPLAAQQTGEAWAEKMKIPEMDSLMLAMNSDDEKQRAWARFHFDKSIPVVGIGSSDIHRILTIHGDDRFREFPQAWIWLNQFKRETSPEMIPGPHGLRHTNSLTRGLCLQYIGQQRLTDHYQDVLAIMREGLVGPELFDIWLATIRHLQPEFAEAYRTKSFEKASSIPRPLPDGFLEGIVFDQSVPQSVRAIALPYLEWSDENKEKLVSAFQKNTQQDFRLAILQYFRLRPHLLPTEDLWAVTLDTGNNSRVRSWAAMLLLSAEKNWKNWEQLLSDEEPVIRHMVLQAFRNSPRADIVDQWWENNATTAEAANWSTYRKGPEIVMDKKEWYAAVDGNGRAAVGEMVFVAQRSTCLNCHKVDGLGNEYGPDLSQIGQSKSERQLMDAILYPSDEIAPEWQSWYVVDQEGKRHLGRQIDVHLNSVELMDANGTFISYGKPQSYGPSAHSLMPEGLEQSMSFQDFNDLIAYLRSLK